jgi:2-phosphosulfolactate phosphatase
MKINILQLIEGARQARGLTVIIDVFRAFTTACYAMHNHAQTIIPIDDIDKAYALKKEYPGYILMGERNDKIPEGFEYGNSPAHIEHVDFTGKTIVHTTSAGTQGIYNATEAGEIITGSFVNIHAIIQYIKKQQPENLSLVCMGYATKYPTLEDTFCAEYIYNALKNKHTDYKAMVEKMKNGPGRRFFEEKNQSFSPRRDFQLCTQLGLFPFILKAEQDKYIHLKQENVILS